MTTAIAMPRWIVTLRWVARGWSVVVLLLAIAIGVTPEADAVPGEAAGIPLIEALALGGYGLAVLGLVLGWARELWGAALAVLGVIVHDVLFYIAKGFQPEWLAGNLIAALIFILPAILYAVCWRRSQGK